MMLITELHENNVDISQCMHDDIWQHTASMCKGTFEREHLPLFHL